MAIKEQADLKYQLDFNAELIAENQAAIENLLDITEKAGISPTTFKARFNKLNSRIQYLKNKRRLIQKTENILKEEVGIKKVVKAGISKFNKLSFEEKQAFIRSLISTVYVRWIQDNLSHLITIDFRIDKLQNYLVSKEMLINRTSGKKRITKIIEEKILIKKIYEDGAEDAFSIKYVD